MEDLPGASGFGHADLLQCRQCRGHGVAKWLKEPECCRLIMCRCQPKGGLFTGADMKIFGSRYPACLALVTACIFSLPGVSYAEEASVGETATTESRPQATPPVLYVFNISGPTLFSGNQDVTDNGKLIASLPRLTHTQLAIVAGAHEFRFKAFPSGKRVASLTAESGKNYYLAVGYNPAKSWAFPLLGDSMLIKMIPADEAEVLLKETKPIESR